MKTDQLMEGQLLERCFAQIELMQLADEVTPFDERTKLNCFFQSLAVASLTEVVDCTDARFIRAVNRLQQQRNATGSFNYWFRGTKESEEEPYPDDLDTTSAALFAIYRSIDDLPAQWMADYVRILTHVESDVGGPYKTWVVDASAGGDWADVDPIVNANVGRLLSCFDVSLPKLDSFLSQVIRDVTITSPYYLDRSMFRYFLSFWYKGEEKRKLVSENRISVRDAMQSRSAHSLAIALASEVRLSGFENRELITDVRESLRQMVQRNQLTSEPVCVHATREGQRMLASSEAFTCALVLEALALTRDVRTDQIIVNATDTLEKDILQRVHDECRRFPNPLAYQARSLVQDVVSHDRWNHFSLLPFQLAEAVMGSKIVMDNNAYQLAAANVLGWAAFSAIDDVLDNEIDSKKLPVSLACARHSLRLFISSLSSSHWKKWCMRVFDIMDAANAFESQRLHLQMQNGERKLPERVSLSSNITVHRSYGLVLAPMGLLLAAGEDSEKIHAVQRFLEHVIASRQLLDDAHDWEVDLQKGRLNSATIILFDTDDRERLFAEGIDAWRKVFWERSLNILADHVRWHVAEARRWASSFDESGVAFVNSVLDPITRNIYLACSQRDAAQKFIQAYNQDV